MYEIVRDYYSFVTTILFLLLSIVAIPYVLISIFVEAASLIDDNEGTLFRRFGLEGITTPYGKEKRFLLPWILYDQNNIHRGHENTLFQSIVLGIILVLLIALLSLVWGLVLLAGILAGIIFILQKSVRKRKILTLHTSAK